MTFLDQLVAECRELIKNAECEDGIAVCFTQDIEAIEAVLEAMEKHRAQLSGKPEKST